MIRPDQIPPAALERGAEYLYQTDDLGGFWPDASDLTKAIYRDHARAAFEAMVEAWPNQHIIDDDVVYILHALILPLPTENPDAEA